MSRARTRTAIPEVAKHPPPPWFQKSLISEPRGKGGGVATLVLRTPNCFLGQGPPNRDRFCPLGSIRILSFPMVLYGFPRFGVSESQPIRARIQVPLSVSYSFNAFWGDGQHLFGPNIKFP